MKSKETRTEHPICYKMTRVSIQKRALQPSWLEDAFRIKDRLQRMRKCARVHQKSEAKKSDRAKKVSSECKQGEQD